MNSSEMDVRDEQAAGSVPEDIALLYSWAQMQGAKYRDFSASRREERAQVLDRSAQTLPKREVQPERRAGVVAEATGTDDAVAGGVARAKFSAPLFNTTAFSANGSARSETERVSLLTTRECAPVLPVLNDTEPSAAEIEPSTTNFELRITAIKQRATNTDMLSALDRVLTQKTSQPVRERVDTKVEDVTVEDPPPTFVARSEDSPVAVIAEAKDTKTPAAVEEDVVPAATEAAIAEAVASLMQSGSSPLLRPMTESERQEGMAPSTSYGKSMRNSISNAIARVLAQNAEHAAAKEECAKAADERPEAIQPEAVETEIIHPETATVTAAEFEAPVIEAAETETAPVEAERSEPAAASIAPIESVPEVVAPLATAAPIDVVALAEESLTPVAQVPVELPPVAQAPVADEHKSETVEDARGAEPWSLLQGVFGLDGEGLTGSGQNERRTPVLAVFSLAGGVGKTNLVATLGRAISAQGQAVLLADTTSRGLLPFYFGARRIRPGEVRTVASQSGAPLSLALYEAAASSADEPQQQALADAILHDGRSSQRVLLDLTTGSSWLIRRMANQRPVVLVPMACDMNSVISLHAVEGIFQAMLDAYGQSLRPYYVLSQFDESLALHRDVREVLHRQLGDRLLQRTIRRAPAVSEALAAGMTVVDYAPTAPVSQEFAELATWLRIISPAAATLGAAGRQA